MTITVSRILSVTAKQELSSPILREELIIENIHMTDVPHDRPKVKLHHGCHNHSLQVTILTMDPQHTAMEQAALQLRFPKNYVLFDLEYDFIVVEQFHDFGWV